MSPPTEAEAISADLLVDIAASEENEARPAILKRLPLSFRPEARFSAVPKLSGGDAVRDPARFERPEGSFEARAFGNTVHAFLELLTKRFAAGASAEVLRVEVAGWTPRIAAVLRGDGLAPSVVDRLAVRVISALNTMLRDADGLWILGPRDKATSEFALTSWDGERSSVRLDRMFLGGPRRAIRETIIFGSSTTKLQRMGTKVWRSSWRKSERSTRPKWKTYAHMIHDRVEPGRLRVGLYYPMLARLVWWEPEMRIAANTD